MTLERITAPWTDAQVEQLNRFQRGGFMHPFTCPRKFHHDYGTGDILLEATTRGWECMSPACDYGQSWAHAFMADREWMDEVEAGSPWLRRHE